MKLLSFRRKFDSRWFFSSEPQYQDGGGPRFSGDAAIARLRAETDGKRVLFVIHGYNVDGAKIVPAYDALECRLAEAGLVGPGARYQSLIGVLWPGHTGPGFWFAIRAANKSGDCLREVLAKLNAFSTSVETHSLGARVALRALEGAAVKELILTSPAVSQACLEMPDGEFWESTGNVYGNVQVCFSRNDDVLGSWYRVSERVLHWLQLSSGNTALGLSGPEKGFRCRINVRTWDFSESVHSHSAWKDDPEFFTRWAAWETSSIARSDEGRRHAVREAQ